MALRLPLGISDFRTLRERRLTYVDKTHLIREILDDEGTQVLLIPRPRRFGKTLNLSMLRCFLERREEDLSHLFEGLSIWEAGEAYRAHFQRYPVISLTFKDIKAASFEACWEELRKKIVALFDEHRYLLDGSALSEVEARQYRQILEGTAGRVYYEGALGDLSRHLHRHHGREAVILLDEYDGPIHDAHVGGYGRQALDLFRSFFTAGLKDNPHVYKAVLSGILRIARESIFSGLNNVAVYTLLRPELCTAFGFTEAEVEALVESAGAAESMDVVREWYNGYLFGGEVIYNPWSVLSYLKQQQREPQPFWVSTSSNDLIRHLLQRRATRLEPALEVLLNGGSIERVLDENVVLDRIETSEDALWSLLVFSGYLRAERRSQGPMEQATHLLSIPNREVRMVYLSTFRDWMEASVTGGGGDMQRLVRALLAGDAATVERDLQAFAVDMLSYHDTGLDPERVYQGFILGLLAALHPGYQVRSNRESGYGRPDVLIRPTRPGLPGVVLELKVARGGKTPEEALEDGLAQIREKDYAAELRAAGAASVYEMAVVFDGKRVWVRSTVPVAPP